MGSLPSGPWTSPAITILAGPSLPPLGINESEARITPAEGLLDSALLALADPKGKATGKQDG